MMRLGQALSLAELLLCFLQGVRLLAWDTHGRTMLPKRWIKYSSSASRNQPRNLCVIVPPEKFKRPVWLKFPACGPNRTQRQRPIIYAYRPCVYGLSSHVALERFPFDWWRSSALIWNLYPLRCLLSDLLTSLRYGFQFLVSCRNGTADIIGPESTCSLLPGSAKRAHDRTERRCRSKGATLARITPACKSQL